MNLLCLVLIGAAHAQDPSASSDSAVSGDKVEATKAEAAHHYERESIKSLSKAPISIPTNYSQIDDALHRCMALENRLNTNSGNLKTSVWVIGIVTAGFGVVTAGSSALDTGFTLDTAKFVIPIGSILTAVGAATIPILTGAHDRNRTRHDEIEPLTTSTLEWEAAHPTPTPLEVKKQYDALALNCFGGGS